MTKFEKDIWDFFFHNIGKNCILDNSYAYTMYDYGKYSYRAIILSVEFDKILRRITVNLQEPNKEIMLLLNNDNSFMVRYYQYPTIRTTLKRRVQNIEELKSVIHIT